jgi:ubiquinone/menaquinone biosynthesis C-methylase UbiE
VGIWWDILKRQLKEIEGYWNSFLKIDDANRIVAPVDFNWKVFESQLYKIFPNVDEAKYWGRLLDLGCGTGRLYNFFSKRYEYIGVDISQTMLKHTRKIYNDEPILILTDGADLPFIDDYFDVVWCWSVFTHIDIDVAYALLKEMKRVIKKNGSIYISYIKSRDEDKEIFINKQKEGKNWIVYSKKEFEKMVKNVGFKLKEVFEMREADEYMQTLLELRI